jgi:hypothetical protein
LPPFLTLPIYICEFSSPSYISNTLSLSLSLSHTQKKKNKNKKNQEEEERKKKKNAFENLCSEENLHAWEKIVF